MPTWPAVKPTASILGSSAICALLLLTGCGGAGSGSSTGTTTPLPPPSPTITSVTVSCTLNTVPVGQTNQCTPNVKGTGSFNPAVTWSVNSVQGGNSTLGTVSSSGLYTAPTSVPSPYTVNVGATSDQDGTKSAFASVVVAGTIASTTQTVTAATGGTVTLPDGSSVTIPANVLTDDQTVTVSKLSAPSSLPPAGSIVNAGPLLNLSLSVPMPQVKMPSRSRSLRQQTSQPNASDIQFSIMIGSNANSTLQGSAPMVDLVTSSGEQNILFPSGSYDQGTQVAQVNIDPSYLSGVQQMNATMANFDSTIPIAPATSWELYWVAGQGFERLPQASSGSCPLLSSFQNANVLILVHGMFSSVEAAFTNSASAMQTAGGYSLVLGFDYDWTQRVGTSGQELADFINSLTNCSGIQRIDIEAHSEGVAVTLSAPGLTATGKAGTQISPQATALIKNVVSLAGPIRGTPLADDPAAFVACYEFQHPLLLWIPPSLAVDLAGAVGDLPPFQDLTSTGDPLSQFRESFAQALPGIQLTAVGGDSPFCGSILNPILELLVFDGHPFDGIMPLDSALGFGAGIPALHPLPPFADDHSELHDDQNVINDVGKQVLQGIPPLATLSCQGSETNCNATQAQAFPFLFLLSTRSLDSNALQVFMQDSTGTVTPQAPNFTYADGGITWSLQPQCSNPPCDFSIFSFDTADTLASNNVMATVESGNGTAGIAFNPTSLNFGSLQTGTNSTQSVTLTNTGTATLQITQINLTNNAGGFSENNPCPASLSAGASCAVSVTFSPTQAGAQSATLSVTDNTSGSPQVVPLSGTGTTGAQAPTVTTSSPPNAVTSSSATLLGTVNPNGSDTNAWFQYSVNSSMSGAKPTQQQDIGFGTNTLQVSAGITGLTANTIYYYQAIASNSAGTTPGGIASFTTPSSGSQLPAPVLIAPSNGATYVAQAPGMQWNAVTGASSYRIVIASNAASLPTDPAGACNGCVVDNSAVPTSPYLVPNGLLTLGTQYWWEVTGQSSNATGTWSQIWNFTVTPPITVTITSTVPTTPTANASPQTVTINGTGFELGAFVFYNSNTSPTYSVAATNVTSNSLQAALTLNTSGPWYLVVKNPDGTLSPPYTITVLAGPPPSIAYISPNPVPAGSAESILIHGSNFQTGGTLHFTWTVDGGGSDNRTDYDFVDSSDLIISINTGTVASTGWTVQMINPDGQSSSVFPFSVQ